MAILRHAIACLLALVALTTDAESLFDDTNLASFGFPDVYAEGLAPYDERVYRTDVVISGTPCCLRQMYRVDNKKVVLLSHGGEPFLAFLITAEASRMFLAAERGDFIERPIEQGGTWQVPDWITAPVQP